jgi:hypothetical protein
VDKEDSLHVNLTPKIQEAIHQKVALKSVNTQTTVHLQKVASKKEIIQTTVHHQKADLKNALNIQMIAHHLHQKVGLKNVNIQTTVHHQKADLENVLNIQTIAHHLHQKVGSEKNVITQMVGLKENLTHQPVIAVMQVTLTALKEEAAALKSTLNR